MLIAQATVPVRIVPDPARYRPNDTPVVLGDASRLTQELGWRPHIPLPQTTSDLLDYWRSACVRHDATAVATRRRELREGDVKKPLPSLLGVAAFACVLTCIVTWPQVLHPTQVADHFNAYFSVWRLAHVAHALTRWPVNLFDGNIFYPLRNTLAYSDATLLEGLLAAPFLWAHLSPSLVYNLLLLAGFVRLRRRHVHSRATRNG